MKIIKRKSNSVVIFAGANLELFDTGATNGDWTDSAVTSANAILAEVDALPADWIGGAYKHTVRGGFELVDPTLVPDRLAELQTVLTAAATARRWEVETGGVVLPNGVQLNTGRGDQDAITRVIVNAGAAGLTEIPFKAASGWVTLSIDQLRGMASVIARHVQACYGRERTHHEAIAALQTVEAAEAYDIGTGWPSNTEATP